MKRWRARLDYQFQGNYKLAYRNSGGQEIVYEKPRGFRGELHLCLIRGKERYYKLAGKCFVYTGAYYERLKFKDERVGNTVSNMTSPLELQQVGLLMGVGF